jgi:hypothetical protein
VPEHQITLIREELDRHSRPRQIATHAQGTAGILTAIEGGVDSVEKGHRPGADAQRGVAVPDPALVPGYL